LKKLHVGEKEDTTEDLLNEFKAERDGLLQEVADLQMEIETKDSHLKQMQEQLSELSQGVSFTSFANNEKDRELELEKRELSDQIEELKCVI